MTPTKKTTTPRRKTPAVKLPPNPFVHEVLELVDKQRSKAKKIEILREYADDALKSILIWNFDQTVVSMVPEGEVPFKKNDVPIGTDHTTLRREWKNLYNFVQGGNAKLSSLRRETMFISAYVSLGCPRCATESFCTAVCCRTALRFLSFPNMPEMHCAWPH